MRVMASSIDLPERTYSSVPLQASRAVCTPINLAVYPGEILPTQERT
jgi:hypothetical protein